MEGLSILTGASFMVTGVGSSIFSPMIEVKSAKGGHGRVQTSVQQKIGPGERGLVYCIRLFFRVVRLRDEAFVC